MGNYFKITPKTQMSIWEDLIDNFFNEKHNEKKKLILKKYGNIEDFINSIKNTKFTISNHNTNINMNLSKLLEIKSLNHKKIEPFLTKYLLLLMKELKEKTDTAINNFLEKGEYKFNINGKPHIVTLHVNNARLNKNAINNMKNFKKPKCLNSKPHSPNNQHQYVWGSTNPLFSEDSWIKWCRSEHLPEWIVGDWYILVIDMENILEIENENIQNFHDSFSDGKLINWNLVSKRYSGVSIMKYIYSARSEYKWYCTWDVDSIVIWDNSPVIAKKKLDEDIKKKIIEMLDKIAVSTNHPEND